MEFVKIHYNIHKKVLNRKQYICKIINEILFFINMYAMPSGKAGKGIQLN